MLISFPHDQASCVSVWMTLSSALPLPPSRHRASPASQGWEGPQRALSPALFKNFLRVGMFGACAPRYGRRRPHVAPEYSNCGQYDHEAELFLIQFELIEM